MIPFPFIRGCPKIGQHGPFVPEFSLNGARFKLIPGFSVPIPILIPCPTLGRFRDRYRFQGWARFDSNTDSDHFWAIPRPIRFWQLLVDSYIDSLPLIRGCPKIGQQRPFVPEFTLNGARFKLIKHVVSQTFFRVMDLFSTQDHIRFQFETETQRIATNSDTDSRDGHDSIPIPIPGLQESSIPDRFR